MAKKVVRKIELFALHAHNVRDLSYEEIFRLLAAVDRENRVYEVSGLVIGFPIVRRVGKRFFIQATEGDPDASALVFNRRTGRTRDASLADTELFSHATHMYVAPESRRAAVEYVRRGVKSVMLGPAIEGILRENYKQFSELRLEFVAVPSPSFIKEIRGFERIRVASIRLTEPNASWTEHYTQLSQLMEESNGAKVEVDVRASRQASLAKNKGIVQAIKDVASDGQPYLDEAKIVGTRKNEPNETTLRASQHVEHIRATIEADDSGVPIESSVREALRTFLQRWI